MEQTGRKWMRNSGQEENEQEIERQGQQWTELGEERKRNGVKDVEG